MKEYKTGQEVKAREKAQAARALRQETKREKKFEMFGEQSKEAERLVDEYQEHRQQQRQAAAEQETRHQEEHRQAPQPERNRRTTPAQDDVPEWEW